MKLGCLLKRRDSTVIPVPPLAALHQLFSVPLIERGFADDGSGSESDIMEEERGRVSDRSSGAFPR